MYAYAQALVVLYMVFLVHAVIGFEWTAAKFFWYLLFMLFIFLYFTFYGMMAVALSAKPQIAIIVSSSFYTIWNLFPGFVVPRPVSISYPLSIKLKRQVSFKHTN